MILSKPASYAIRALTYLACCKQDEPVLSSRIAAEQDIPPQFLIKLMGTLMKAGIVRSTRGPGGGFTLATDPNKISLFDVLRLFEGDGLNNECLLGLGRCSDSTACEVHQKWKSPKGGLLRFFRQVSIAEVARTASSSSHPPRKDPNK